MSLFDALQAASNATAETVSGPVDLFSYLLRKVGADPGPAPFGGSEWMRRKGLTREVPMGASRIAGETFGLLAPAVIAAKAPQIASGLLKGEEAAKRGAYAVGEKAADMTGDYMARTGMIQPATVYHGSPHKFDKFDSSKIGSGEGSQAYGHGLYLAEAPETARSYQAMANSPARRQGGLTAAGADQATLDSIIKLNASKFTGGDVEKLAEVVKKHPGAFQKPEAMLARIAEYQDNLAPSYLYKVDLPDTAIAKMLDWDKPLSQQSPETIKALRKVADRFPGLSDALQPFELGSTTGATVNSYMSRVKDPNAAAAAFKEAGIPGIRYLDGGSRGAGTGTSNYVVFPGEEGLLNILERNGQSLRGLMGPSRTLNEVRDTWQKSGVTLDVGSSKIQPNILNLSKIEVPKGSRGQGIGSAAMTDLVKYADETGKMVALSPSVDFGASSKARLVEFYKRFGFVENKGKNKDFTISETMYRPAKP